MKARSIRWQLPLSYAGIAFLAALSLGIVLLTVVRSHYFSEERGYLEAQAISHSYLLGDLLRLPDIPVEKIAESVNQLSFLSDTRIQVLDADGNILADSGVPSTMYFEFVAGSEAPALVESMIQTGMELIIEDFFGGVQVPNSSDDQDQTISINLLSDYVTTSDIVYLPLSKSMFGSFVASEDTANWKEIQRSSQTFTQPIRDTEDDMLVGSLIVSDGPAIGREILNNVTSGWLVASCVAIMIAGLMGWLISLRITRPLTRLTAVTVAMSDGDLSVRTTIKRSDELGILAESFNTMAYRVENTVMALRRFVADAAHELYTPLTALRTNLELAQEQQNTHTIGRALDQVMRIQALAEGLLDLSRLEGLGDTTWEPAIDMNALIQKTASRFASRVEQSNLRLSLGLAEAISPVSGNTQLLTRMLENLLDNAVKFTPPEGCIQVTTQAIEQGIQITINDSGIGIPEDDLPHLFQRFRRGHNTADYPGSGLGLAIVKVIADKHHGEVMIHSSGSGTCVMMQLPILATPHS